MAKRGYKLQEFVAHSANVNCIKFGKKTRKHFITGGDDEIVNLWPIGNSKSIASLSGHTSPIESVAFDSTEVLVAAGASSGVVKLWDLEETKVVRTLNGHRSYCIVVEFHPFGEFFASGSMDTNLKIWDFRKKECIRTYKGHKRAISTIRFTPDGRWVVSGGLDNVVKVWPYGAGKLLHEFKFHEGHIRSMSFHPLEFLLATGSSDRTVKFWDLETFELIGSTRPEETGVRSITFHPDGKTLFCGLDNSLKVYSWEPIVCHDDVDITWSTLGDLCIDDGKLFGCSHYQNSVSVWVSDVSQIDPYVHSTPTKESTRMEPKFYASRRSFTPPDDDTKDIKNIYVDSVTLNSVSTRETDVRATENLKQVSLKPPHRRGPSSTNLDLQGLSSTLDSVLNSVSDTATNTNIQRRLFTDDPTKDEKNPSLTYVAEEFHKSSSLVNTELNSVKYVNEVTVVNGRTRSLVERFEKIDTLTNDRQEPDLAAPILSNTVNVSANTVEHSCNVVSCANVETKTSPISLKTTHLVPEKVKVSPIQKPVAPRRVISEKVKSSPMTVTRRSRANSHITPERTKTKFYPLSEDSPQTTGRCMGFKNDDNNNVDVADDLMLDHESLITTLRSRLTKLQVVRHFWDLNDMMGAINVSNKLPDHAVQADVISVMLINIECLTLDLFSCLLPLLLGLLGSQTERHINVSLKMLLKLIAAFGCVITSTISAPPTVGVNIQAEKRLESCNQCHVLLQNIHQLLPGVIRLGGLTAKSAQELNLILQQL
ncbi:katanin p80 WD40 repeat-containing subunit B1 homolog KTN80.1-like [Rutidosis leptorrhynchoides]|uniref:katanin p80 WD40 repeat-containing subunit B1 homolog KTN80.1-like n=1 Tax=Rutidosis leptorrhynchoides TaxID=125765 RepID=UPI003A99ABF7